MTIDPTRIEIETDPKLKRMRGRAYHGNTPFDVPFISEIAPNLWQGGCETGLVLPDHIRHVVSLYPWERYRTHGLVMSEMYVEMFDAEDQGFDQVDSIARWVNDCRDTGDVLVHCQAGLNRSSLVAARAIHLREGFPGDEIVEDLRRLRSPAVLCNSSFEDEVRSWT